MKPVRLITLAALIFCSSSLKAQAGGFGELVRSNAKANQASCVVKKPTPAKFFSLDEIFPTVIYKTPGRDAGSAQLFQPVRNIAEPLALLGAQCLAHNQVIKMSSHGEDWPNSCDDFKNWIETMVEQDALHFDRNKHKVSKVSFATGTLSGSMTIRPIAFYISALRDNKLVNFKNDHAVDNWLKRRVKEYEEVPSKLSPTAAQNHVLYSVLANLIVGIATEDDSVAIRQAEEIYKLYMDTARPDGSFPRETNRGVSALKYENMTITGLLILGELMQYRRKDLYAYKSPSGVDIHKSVEFFLKAYADESVITGYASENYAPTDRDDGNGQSKLFVRDHMGWIQLYLRHFPNSQNSTLLRVLAATPSVSVAGSYDENMGGISGCIW